MADKLPVYGESLDEYISTTDGGESTTSAPKAPQYGEGLDQYLSRAESAPQAEATPPTNGKGILNDTLIGLGRGTLQLPSVATGLADVGAGILGYNKPFSKAADILGEKTGFQPAKWAEEGEQAYSPAMQQAGKNVQAAWDDPNTGALDVAKAYVQNPRQIGKTIVESLPGMVAGAKLGNAVTGLNKLLTAPGVTATEIGKRAALASGVGEGAVMAGQSMSGMAPEGDAQKQALAAAGVGVLGGAIGAGSGAIANKLGLGDIDQFIASGGRAGVAQTAAGNPLTAMGKRIVGGAIQEGPIEEGLQSAEESALQNWANGRPLTEGMARNVVEGSLAGAAMGGPMGVFTRKPENPTETGEQDAGATDNTGPLNQQDPEDADVTGSQFADRRDAGPNGTPPAEPVVEDNAPPAAVVNTESENPEDNEKVLKAVDTTLARIGKKVAGGVEPVYDDSLLNVMKAMGVAYDKNKPALQVFKDLQALRNPPKTPDEKVAAVTEDLQATLDAAPVKGVAGNAARAALDSGITNPQQEAAAPVAEETPAEEHAPVAETPAPEEAAAETAPAEEPNPYAPEALAPHSVATLTQMANALRGSKTVPKEQKRQWLESIYAVRDEKIKQGAAATSPKPQAQADNLAGLPDLSDVDEGAPATPETHVTPDMVFDAAAAEHPTDEQDEADWEAEREQDRRIQQAQDEVANNAVEKSSPGPVDGSRGAQPQIQQEGRNPTVGGPGVSPSRQESGDIQPKQPQTPVPQTGKLDVQSQNTAPQTGSQETQEGQVAPKALWQQTQEEAGRDYMQTVLLPRLQQDLAKAKKTVGKPLGYKTKAAYIRDLTALVEEAANPTPETAAKYAGHVDHFKAVREAAERGEAIPENVRAEYGDNLPAPQPAAETPVTNIHPVDDAFALAPTSSTNDLQVSEADLKEGKYPKPAIPFAGLMISGENRFGSMRRGTDPNGKKWEQQLQDNYGEISGVADANGDIKPVIGSDGDAVDIFIRPNMTQEDIAALDKVYVVDQVDPKTGEFDEHKVVAGRSTEAEAITAYNSNYQNGWNGLGAITEMSLPEFKEWLRSGDTTVPVSPELRGGEVEAAEIEHTPAEPEALSPKQTIQKLREQAKRLHQEAIDYNNSTGGRAAKNKGRNNMHETNPGYIGPRTYRAPGLENAESAHLRGLQERKKAVLDEIKKLESTLEKKPVKRTLKWAARSVKSENSFGYTKDSGKSMVNTRTITNIGQDLLDHLGYKSLYFKPGAVQEVYAEQKDGGIKHLFDGDVQGAIDYVNGELRGTTTGQPQLSTPITEGSTGPVHREGDEAVKTATGNEGAIYALLNGVEGIAKGYEADGKIRTPFYRNVVSVDTIAPERRAQLRGLVAKNASRINRAVSALTNAGYDYNDPLQFGLSDAKTFDLMDFSNAMPAPREDAIRNNLGHLSGFYKQFGAERVSNAVSQVADVLGYQRSMAEDADLFDFFGENIDGVDYRNLVDALNGAKAEYAYYATNARHIALKGIAQTGVVNGVNAVLSTRPLTENEISTWELTPVYESTLPKPQASSNGSQNLPTDVFTSAADAHVFLSDKFGPGIDRLVATGMLNFTQGKEAWPEIARQGTVDRDEAVYINGKAYLDLRAIARDRLPAIVLHEIGEHYNLARMLGTPAYKSLQDQIANRAKIRGSQAEKIWNQVKRAYVRPEDPSKVIEGRHYLIEGDDHFMSEVIAKLGENDPKAPWYKRLLAQIKSFLLQHGLARGFVTGTMTEADLHELLKTSLRSAADGRKLNEARYYRPLAQYALDVWHGSPHDHDKFDSAKIGTGEGAQAFGYGHYFTNKKEIAQYYRDTLSSIFNDLKKAVSKDFDVSDDAVRVLIEVVGEVKRGAYSRGDAARKAGYRSIELRNLPTADLRKIVDTALNLEKSGKLYEVELAPEEDELLDWDKPLSEQSEKVRTALGVAELTENNLPKGYEIKDETAAKLTDWDRSIGRSGYFTIYKSGKDHIQGYNSLKDALEAVKMEAGLYQNGDGLYHDLMNDLGSPEAASDYLHSIGIRGIKYAAEGGKSDASNYVIFSDDDISIKAKYSRPQYSFAGEKAETADRFALSTAKDRITAGDDPDTVRRETGWFQWKPDNRWRFEIDDSGAKLNIGVFGNLASFKDSHRQGATVGQLLDHPKLFAAYPQLAKTPLAIVSRSMLDGANGGVSGNRVFLAEDLGKKEALSSLMHELQHGIQNVEGFAVGATPESVTPSNYKAQQIEFIHHLEDLLAKAEQSGDTTQAKKVSEDLRKIQSAASYDAYKRAAGEVEARNVQARLRMSAKERLRTPPSKTQDTRDTDTIVVFGGKELKDVPRMANLEPKYSRPAEETEDSPAYKEWAKQVQNKLDESADKVFSQRLAFLSVRQIADYAKKILPGISAYVDHMEGRVRVVSERLREADNTLSPWKSLAKKDRDALNQAMRDSTRAEIDPSLNWSGIIETRSQRFRVYTQTKFSAARQAHLDSEGVRLGGTNVSKRSATFTDRASAEEYLRLLNQFSADQAQYRAKNNYPDVNIGRQKDYLRLRQTYLNMSETQQKVFNKAHLDLSRLHRAKLQALVDRVNEAVLDVSKRKEMIAALRLRFEAQMIMGYYAPLFRHGEHWFYGKKDGKNYFRTFESEKGRDKARDEFIAAGGTSIKSGTSIRDLTDVKMEGGSEAFVLEVNKLIGSKELDPAVQKSLMDDIYQMYLDTLPEVSMRHSSQHRLGTYGEEEDQMQAYSHAMHHGATQLANMIYGRRMEQVLKDNEAAIKLSSDPYLKKKTLIEIEAAEDLGPYWTTAGHEYRDSPQRNELASAAMAEMIDGQLAEAVLAGDEEQEIYWTQAKELRSRFRDLAPEAAEDSLQHHADKLRAIARMSNGLSFENNRKASDVVSELTRSYKAMVATNSTAMDQLAAYARQMGFIWTLGFGISSAALNLVQTPVVALPVAVGKHGWKASTKAFSRSLKDFMQAGALFFEKDANGNYIGRDADGNMSMTESLKRQAMQTSDPAELDRLHDRIDNLEERKDDGTISRTQTFDVIGIGQEGEAHGGALLELSKKMGWMFHHGERFNREITLDAAFTLARDAGMNRTQASAYAKKVTDEAHGDYSSENAARIFRGWPSAIALQYKKYPQAMFWLWGKQAADMIENRGWKNLPEGPEREAAKREAQEAARTLGALFTMQTAAAGIFGLPLTGALVVVLNALGNAASDDDEPFDIEREVRVWLTQHFGETFATATVNGAINALTPVNASDRMNLKDVLFREPLQDKEGQDAYAAYVSQLAGPTGGTISKLLFEAPKLALEGHLYRAVETAMPKAVADLMKAMRYQSEGLTSLKDEKLRDMSLDEVLFQAAGFSSSRNEKFYAERGYAKAAENAIKETRQAIVNRAVRDKLDGETVSFEEIRAWNKKHPEWPITGDSLRRSLQRTKQNATARGDRGYAVNPKLDYLYEQNALTETED